MAHINQALHNEALKKLMNAIAGREGIRVVFDRECESPHASKSKVITLKPPGAIDALEYWYTAYHELGHLLEELDWSYTKLFGLLNMKDQLVMGLANIIMDNLDEKNFYGRYEGVDDILSKGRAQWANVDWMSMTPEEIKAKHEGEIVNTVILSVMMEDLLERQDWQGHHVEALSVGDYDDCFVAFRNELRGIGFTTRLKSILFAKRPEIVTRDLVLDILKLIDYEPPPPEPQEGEGDGDGTCNECGGSGQDPSTGDECEACGGTGKDKGEQGEGQGDAKEGEGEGQGDGDSEERKNDLSEADPSWDPDGIGKGIAGSKLTLTNDDLSNMETILSRINEDLTKSLKREKKTKPLVRGWDRRASTYIPWHENKIKNFEKSVESYRPHQHEAIISALGSSTVSKQISKYLKALVTESYTYGQKRGRIHQKNMHRIISQKPQPGIAPSVFKTKNSSTLKTDSAVTLLLDCSGSMSGSKYSIGSACCVALSECLQSIRVPHEILGFTENEALESYVFKGFGTQFTKEKLLKLMANTGVDLGNNADGESVMWAAERLLGRRETKKLLIVLSDGHPAGYFQGDGNAYLKTVVEMLEKESPLDVVGIGINSTAVERFYTNHVVVDDPRMLDETLFSVLKTYLV